MPQAGAIHRDRVPLQDEGDSDMNMNELFKDDHSCVQCQHDVDKHTVAVGTDSVRRLFCESCPLSTIRVMGDEGVENPIPFFIEGPIGAPDPCFEEKHASRKRENFLPRSPGPYSAHQITLHGKGERIDCESRFSGTDWRVNEIEELGLGDEVRRNLVYKLQLYWDQEGLCPGCNGRIRFDNMEMDRLTPGSDGGGYTVGNVQLLCSACNRIKGDRDMEYLKVRRRSQGFLDSQL